MWFWSAPANAQSVTWQILPFPQINWGGSQGQPATTNGNLITLQGQPVRTVQSFSGPLRISYDVVLDARATSDGALELFLIPPGTPTTQMLPSMGIFMIFRNSGGDGLMIYTNSGGSLAPAMDEIPFSLNAQTLYHVTLDISANGSIRSVINNQTNTIPDTVTVPYPQYQLELQGWQPDDVWHISNVIAVPEPRAVTLVVFGLASILCLVRRNGSQAPCNSKS
jgi:hypothetical protein